MDAIERKRITLEALSAVEDVVKMTQEYMKNSPPVHFADQPLTEALAVLAATANISVALAVQVMEIPRELWNKEIIQATIDTRNALEAKKKG